MCGKIGILRFLAEGGGLLYTKLIFSALTEMCSLNKLCVRNERL